MTADSSRDGELLGSMHNQSEAEALRATGLFDETYYVRVNPGIAHETAAEHFCRHGWREGRNPNKYFDVQYYMEQLPPTDRSNVNPVLHYASVGESRGLRPNFYFDPSWYRSRYGLADSEPALKHLLEHVRLGEVSPTPEFDTAFYIARDPNIRAKGVDPFMHYLEWGFREGRDPAPDFDARAYVERHLGGKLSEPPLLHYLRRHRQRKSTEIASQPASSGTADFISPDLGAALRDPTIFDLAYYRRRYCPGLGEADAVIDFLMHPMRQASPYFDPNWYLEQNPEAGRGAWGPLLHYYTTGRQLGLWPSPIFDGSYVTMSAEQAGEIIKGSGLFDTNWYMHTQLDVARAGKDALQHYAAVGHQEYRRSPNALFDATWYRREVPDVETYGWNPLVHYILAGSCRSLSTHPLLDIAWFETTYGNDLADGSPLARLGRDSVTSGTNPNQWFDSRYYVAQCPDAANAPGGPLGHYLEVGWRSDLDPSERFSTSAYLRSNPDVRASGGNPLLHFMTHGRAEGRAAKPLPKELPSELERFGQPEYGATGATIEYDAEARLPDDFGLSIAVHLHLFYSELADEFRRYLSNIPVPFHLFVSAPQEGVDTEEIRAKFAAGLANCTQVVVTLSPNRGRDIAALVSVFGKQLLDYDLLLHVHSKRSPHSRDHANWRQYLLHYTLGNRAVVTQILTAFLVDPGIGIFQPPYHPEVRSQPKWGNNRERALRFLRSLGLSYVGESCPDFPAGSFFWARTDSLRPLLDGRISLDDFEEEAGQTDATLAHAIERLLGLIPVLRGYSVVCRFVDVAHNLTNYYGSSRPFREFAWDRTADIIRYQDAVRARPRPRGRIAVVTAIIGPFDALLLPYHLEAEIDYYCVSDLVTDGYGVFRIVQPPYVDADPRRSARFVKSNLLRLFPGYDFVVWIDANVLVRAAISDFVTATAASGCCVGAIPHAIRHSYLEEATAIAEMKLDEPELVELQVQAYQKVEGLAEAPLIETNFMVLNAHDPQTARFMQLWWNEINTYSRRDQLSVNYSLIQAGLTWHPLLEEFRSVRDSDAFALFGHGLNEWGATPHIYATWHSPYSHEGHLLPLPDDHRATPRVDELDLDVVVCVRNALEDVRACLASVEEALRGRGGIVIVDDDSDSATEEYLAAFAATSGAILLRNGSRLGYTKSANLGMRASKRRHILLLNSDTVVPRDALAKLSHALDRDPLLGIIGPISNAASSQSVPSIVGTNTQTAVNELPNGMSPDELDLFLERHWDGRVVRVPLVHGFCLCVKRAVFEKIGLFDEESFPLGYGEESDFCFRAVDAGYDLGVLTSTFVFHAKSRSFGEQERLGLMSDGMAALVRKATKGRVQRAIRTMEQEPTLASVRRMVQSRFETCHRALRPTRQGRLFLIPELRADGMPAGSAYVRILLPYGSDAICQEWEPITSYSSKLPSLTPDDTIVVHRGGGVIGADELDDWISDVRRSGARLIYDIDDDLLDGTAMRRRGFSGDVRQLARRVSLFVRTADCVTVSSDALRKRLAVMNRNVVFVPNALDPNLWQFTEALNTTPPFVAQAEASRRRRITVGYIGTPTHDHDLAMLSDVVRELRGRFAERLEVQVIGGFQQRRQTFGSLIELPAENDYPSFIRWLRANVRWDIGVIPLAPDRFNAHKSYLKFLEYSALGMAVVCSNVPEYRKVVRHGENGLLVSDDPAEWLSAICRLVEHPEQRKRLACAAFDDVRRCHTLDSVMLTLLHVLSPPAPASAVDTRVAADNVL
jgi:GT2 family glycosyltransferase/glycosyltransferase involved in cell wall biosynthesis